MSELDTAEERLNLVMPNPENPGAIETFIRTELQPHRDIRGVKTLAKSLQQYVKIRNYAAKHLERAQRNLATVNGTRTTSQQTGDKSRSLRYVAQKFYESVDTNDHSPNCAMLRQYCSVFGLNFDSYETIEDVIKALVDRHVDMQVQQD
jgi:hypothetical protein